MPRCAGCGASCQGQRVRVRSGERDAIAAHAAELGIPTPFSGPWLRQSWGTCAFFDDGCALHRRFGYDAKPADCRQFPRLDAGDDPSCFDAATPSGPPAADVGWGDLEAGSEARRWLDALPLTALLEGPSLGPRVTLALAPLLRAHPRPVPETARDRLGRQFEVARALIPHPEPIFALLGGAQLLAGADRLHDFPAWVRLLKLPLPPLSPR